MLAKALAAALVLTSVATQVASETAPIGARGKLEFPYFGCKALADAVTVRKLALAGDGKAVEKLFRSRFPACMPLDEGTVGSIEGPPDQQGYTCLRPRGEPDCFYFPSSIVIAP